MGDDRTGKTRARTWPSAAPGRAGATVPVWLQGARGLTDLLSGWLRAWIAAEIAPGRLVIWLPVAFGIGVILYFAADREPFWWAALLATAAGVAAAIGLRNRAVGFPVALGLTAVAAGFAAATMKSQRISHPVLPAAVYVTALSGFVETREERERTDRIVIAVHTIEGSRLPGAVGRISAFGVAPLLLGTAGIVVLCLLRSPLRFGGAVLLAVACGFAATTRQPDVLVSADARMVAVRTDNGRYSVMSAAGGNGDAFTLRTWLAADGDGRQPGDESLSQDVRCDKAGCVVARGRGITIAQPHTPEAAAEDCERATVVIWSGAPSPAGCRAMLVDAAEIRASGAIALLHNGENEEDKNYEVIRARPRGQERPWMHNWTRNQTADRKAGAGTAAPTALPDVTPRTDDVAVEDP